MPVSTLPAHNFYTDIDGSRVAQILDFRVQNLTTSERNTLAAALGADNEGIHVWDVTEKLQYYWNGTAFIQGVALIQGAMVYKGTHTSLSTAPVGADIGYTYVFTGTAGTLTWSGQTFFPDAEIQPSDMLIYRGTNVWDNIQGDDDYATETDAGNVRLAAQSLVNAGVNTTDVVVPSTLNGYRISKALASTYFENGVTTVALTPKRITHGLNLQNKDSYIASVKNSSSQEITVSIVSFDANSFDIISSVALTNLKVTVIGF